LILIAKSRPAPMRVKAIRDRTAVTRVKRARIEWGRSCTGIPSSPAAPSLKLHPHTSYSDTMWALLIAVGLELQILERSASLLLVTVRVGTAREAPPTKP